MPFGFVKTEVNLPQEYATAVDIGYPVDAFWFSFSQIHFNYLDFLSLDYEQVRHFYNMYYRNVYVTFKLYIDVFIG